VRLIGIQIGNRIECVARCSYQDFLDVSNMKSSCAQTSIYKFRFVLCLVRAQKTCPQAFRIDHRNQSRMLRFGTCFPFTVLLMAKYNNRTVNRSLKKVRCGWMESTVLGSVKIFSSLWQKNAWRFRILQGRVRKQNSAIKNSVRPRSDRQGLAKNRISLLLAVDFTFP